MKHENKQVCPKCKGAGETEETRGGAGDPEYDVPVTCDACKGKGEITQEMLDEYEEVYGDDYENVCDHEKDYVEQTDPRQQCWE